MRKGRGLTRWCAGMLIVFVAMILINKRSNLAAAKTLAFFGPSREFYK